MRCNGIQYLFRVCNYLQFIYLPAVFHVKFMTDTEMRLEGKVLDVSKVWFDDTHRGGILGHLGLLYIILLGPK